METKYTKRLLLPLTPELLDAVEDWQHAKRLPSRAAAIRELLAAGIKARAEANEATSGGAQ